MSILAALVRAQEASGEDLPPGFAVQNVGVLVSLREDGTIARVVDLRTANGKRMVPRALAVPAPVKRTVNVLPNRMWDKTAYVFGRSVKDDPKDAQRLEAFREANLALVEGSDDPGLNAFRRFLETLTPEQFGEPLFAEDMIDQNVVFALGDDFMRDEYLHDRPAAREALERSGETEGEAGGAMACLVTGERAPIARLHPSIKGVWGGQSSGGSIVAFNEDAFTSFGHDKGDNAPVSEKATALYTAALNRMLADPGHRVQVGDASTVFWAEADGEEREVVQNSLAAIMGARATGDGMRAANPERVKTILEQVSKGIPTADVAPELKGIRAYVLGLSPNAARISVRFWLEDSFVRLADRYGRYAREMRIEPPPRGGLPGVYHLMEEVAPLRKRENVPPNLAGDTMRAILAGTPYPMTLLTALLMRLRVDGDVNGRRAAMLRALLIRNLNAIEEGALVALDPDFQNRGYLLGRLFAAYEHVQFAALGQVNASLKDKFYGAASAQPRAVFQQLEKNSSNHLSKVGKSSMGRRVNLEKQIMEIMDRFEPGDDPIPASLPVADQALFGMGYYHQRSKFFERKDSAPDGDAAEDKNETDSAETIND